MNDQPIKIEFALNFRRSLKQIKKHYHHAAEDLKSLTDRLEQGEVVGDQIQGVGYTVYKARVPNRDAQKGQSGGYRVIYYLKTAALIYLLDIYSKNSQQNIQSKTIRRIIAEEIEPPVE